MTATDSLQRTGTYSFTVDVRDVGPQLVLSPNCPNGSSANCDKHNVDLGTATGLTGVVNHAGAHDMETVKVSWGDGTTDSAFVADGGNSRAYNLQVTSASATAVDVSDLTPMQNRAITRAPLR